MRSAGGWVKALVSLAPNGVILGIANSFTSRPDGNNGPITLQRIDTGIYVIDFGFTVNDRFVVATPLLSAVAMPQNPLGPAYLPPQGPWATNYHIVNVQFPGATQVMVAMYAPVLVGTAGSYVLQGYQPTDCSVSVAVF